MRTTMVGMALLVAVPMAATAEEPTRYPATLAGHALLPAPTAIVPPADAPADFKVSGRFTSPDGRRVDALGSIEGTSFVSAKGAPRKTGFKLPMTGQPVQGFSGIRTVGDGTYWVLTDNGFGSKGNSSDAMLMVHRVRPDWRTGKVERLSTVFLHDPDRKVPFRIATEGTARRYLTGADFDIESIQPIGGAIWLGDEFGPYLLKVDLEGKVLAVFETEVDGKVARSPDHYRVTTPAVPTGGVAFNVRRSRGYEGMAASRDGKHLYPLLEGPLWDAEKKDWEKVDGNEVLRILEFSVAEGKWTGRHWKYPLELAGNNIGDFNMIDATTALVIERDNGEGDAARACPEGKPAPDCFNVPARFRRIYRIEMTDANAGGPVRKIGYIDLMDIADPGKLARQGGKDGKLTFPFVTIENVDVVNATQIIVGNDNNFPYSSGREPQKQDDNELVLLDVAELLKAR
jgi:hypothetical protein